MPINRVSDEVRAEKHKADIARHRAQRNAGEMPRIANVRPVLWLKDPVRWPYRGRMYEVPPIGFEDGARVLEFMEWARGISKRKSPEGFAEEYRERMGEAVRLIRRCVIPERGKWRRLLWRLRLLPNPWATASDLEVSELMGFFCAYQTMSPDRLAEAVPAPSTS